MRWNKNGGRNQCVNLPEPGRKSEVISTFGLNMNSLDLSVFATCFRQACLKCFGPSFGNSVDGNGEQLLYNQVFERTGLTIGWKSLKNYSFFVLAVLP